MVKLLLTGILALFMGSVTSGCVVVTGASVEGPSKIKAKVAVARTAMSAGHQIVSSDYELVDRALSTCPSNAYRQLNQLEGKKTKKAIEVGQILTSQDIE